MLDKLNIKDGPGKLTVSTMRTMFEHMVKGTERFSDQPLQIVEKDGAFSHYANQKTDIFWMGFALGLRCAERIERNGQLVYDADRLGVKVSEPTLST